LYLSIPREAWNTPAKKVAVKANPRYREGSCVKETFSLNIDPITKDAIETGPTPRCLELPSSEYINGGTKLESAPCSSHFNRYFFSHNILQQPRRKKSHFYDREERNTNIDR